MWITLLSLLFTLRGPLKKKKSTPLVKILSSTKLSLLSRATNFIGKSHRICLQLYAGNQLWMPLLTIRLDNRFGKYWENLSPQLHSLLWCLDLCLAKAFLPLKYKLVILLSYESCGYALLINFLTWKFSHIENTVLRLLQDELLQCVSLCCWSKKIPFHILCIYILFFHLHPFANFSPSEC